jgi:hypothetical protein
MYSSVEHSNVAGDRGGGLVGMPRQSRIFLMASEETKATLRCIPLNQAKESGECIYCGKPANERAYFAKAY